MKDYLKGFAGVVYDKSSIKQGPIILREPMVNNFIGLVKRDRKKYSNINIYYETMNQENCKNLGVPYDLKTLNCYDGDQAWKGQKLLREANGYVFLEPETVNVGGITCKRIIISAPSKRGSDFDDHFGLMTGYVQAGHEVVCYMVHYK